MLLRDYFSWGSQTYVMAVLNLSPDSFSGNGLSVRDKMDLHVIVEQAQLFVADGAHILDVGGESTRPGAIKITAEEELQLVIPVIEALASVLNVPISIDTYKADVAAAALEAGASIVNDVCGLHMDPEMGAVVAAANAPVILMHNRSHESDAVYDTRLGGRYVGSGYDNLLDDITNELQDSMALAESAGIPHDQIILDPGIGFGKTSRHNIQILQNLKMFKKLRCNILIGLSRKRFISDLSKKERPIDRIAGTIAANQYALDQGVDIIRVHDVQEAFQAKKVWQKLQKR